VIDGIPDFLGPVDVYWGEVAIEEMEQAIDVAKRSGFRESLLHVVSKHPDLGHYLLSPARIDWLFHCLSSGSTGTCLDIGSSWGNLSFSLAEYFDEVWSLEAVWPKIEFQKIVKAQENRDNVHVVRGGSLNLPFPSAYFDLVTANGVLEWAGTEDPSRHPRQVQLAFLREIKRVLKPTGCLYIGIENRLGVQFLLGARDHSGLPYTSVVPRRIADLAVKVLGKTGGAHQANRWSREEQNSYRTYTYTGPGYEKLLREAGYQHSKLYWSLDYNLPLFAGRVKDPQSVTFFARHVKSNMGGDKQTIIERLLLSLVPWLPDFLVEGMVLLFSPSYLIYAYPGQTVASLESEVAALGNCGSFLRRSGAGSKNAKINYFLLRDGHMESVAKFPRFRDSTTQLEKEESLMALHNDLAIEKHEIGGVTVFTEPDLRAVRCKLDDRVDMNKALRWLMAFQEETRNGLWAPAALEEEMTDLQRYIGETARHLAVDTRRRVEGDLEMFREQATRMGLDKVSEHGDFCTWNILKSGERIHVVDWEFYRAEGNPLFDFCFFLMVNVGEASFRKRGLRDAFYKNELYRNLTGKGKHSETVRHLLSEYLEGTGFPPQTVFCGMTYMMSRCLRRYDPRFGNWTANYDAFTDHLEMWSRVAYDDSVFRSLEA